MGLDCAIGYICSMGDLDKLKESVQEDDNDIVCVGMDCIGNAVCGLVLLV